MKRPPNNLFNRDGALQKVGMSSQHADAKQSRDVSEGDLIFEPISYEGGVGKRVYNVLLGFGTVTGIQPYYDHEHKKTRKSFVVSWDRRTTFDEIERELSRMYFRLDDLIFVKGSSQ